jgi:hypothetical protein
MADEQKSMGVLSLIVIIFLTLLVFGVMMGTFFPDSFFNNTI